MDRIFRLSLLAGACAVALAFPALAQEDTTPGFRGKLYGAGFRTFSGFETALSAGYGLGLEYRFTERLGLELDAASTELEDTLGVPVIAIFPLEIESKVRVTPVTLQLNWHLTPGRKGDLHFGPVVGWASAGDLELTVRTGFPFPEKITQRFATDDAFVWGAHLDFDLPLGDRGVFLALGATYLNGEIDTHFESGDEVPEGETKIEFDPLVARLGIGYRF